MTCDAGLKCTCAKHKVIIYGPAVLTIKVQGWCEDSSLWRFLLVDLELKNSTFELWITPQNTIQLNFKANNAYDLKSIEALIKNYHAMAGFPIKEVWLAAVKNNHHTT